MQDFESRNPSDTKLKSVLSSQEIKAFHQKSNLKAIGGILRAWLPILMVFYVQSLIHNVWLYMAFIPVGAFIVASRLHAFAGLTHEAVHANMFKNRKLNDFVGRYLFSYPLFVSYSRYKKLHMEHHRHLYTDKDPDTPIYLRYPIIKKKFRELLKKDISMRSVIQNLNYFAELPAFLKEKAPKSASGQRMILEYESDKLSFYTFHAVVLFAMFLTGNILAYLLFWILPYMTFLQVFLRIRSALEHGAVSQKHNPLLNTRTVTDNPVVLSFMAPLGLNYHLEHHLYPAVPWYRLHKLHRSIEKSEASKHVNFVSSYRVAVTELTK